MNQGPRYKRLQNSKREESNNCELPPRSKRLRKGCVACFLIVFVSCIIWRTVLASAGGAELPRNAMNINPVVNWNQVEYMFVL